MKQSGCQIPAWMDALPKLTKRDKRRMKQNMVKRSDIDSTGRVGDHRMNTKTKGKDKKKAKKDR
jgi:hypothetical protein